MRLFVPACGDRLTLTEDWTFPLYLERRNVKFAKARGLLPKDSKDCHVFEGELYRSGYKRVEVTLPAGTVIECDRVYIRGFNKSNVRVDQDFDSITWKVIGKNGKVVRNHRFWTKLSHCNGLEFELGEDSLYRDRIKLVKEVMES